MPSELKPDAACPKCGNDLAAVIWTRAKGTVTAEFIHARGCPRARRIRKCTLVLTVEQESALRKELHEAPHA